MSVKTFAVGEVLTASDTNVFLANAGLVAVSPTSVTSGSIVSGTATATANAAVSSIILNGVFSSTYEAYRIVISNLTMSSTSAGTVIWIRMHDGTNPAATNYNYGLTKIDIASGAITANYGALIANGVVAGFGTGDKFGSSFDVINPQLATHTIFTGLNGVNVSTGYFYTGSGMHQTSTAYTGIQFYPSTGTITGGSFTVYGYRR